MAFPLKKILAFLPNSFVVGLSEVEIHSEDPNQLRLDADGWLVVFDKQTRLVSRSGRTLASFSAVEAVDIQCFVKRRVEWWTLSLTLKGGRKLSIGRSADGAQVSIVAARAATFMGKKVLVTQGVSF